MGPSYVSEPQALIHPAVLESGGQACFQECGSGGEQIDPTGQHTILFMESPECCQ